MEILNPWSLYLEAFFLMCFVFVVVENILGQSSVKDKHACHSVPHNYFRASDEAVTHSCVQMGNISSSRQHPPRRSQRSISKPPFPSSSWADMKAVSRSHDIRKSPGPGTRHGPRHHHLCLWGLLVSNLIKSPGDLFQSVSPLETNYFLN